MIVRTDTIFKHILELFYFDRCEGTTTRYFVDSIPLTSLFTSVGDIEFSENGRYMYVANGEIILQMDLESPDFFSNRDTIAQWDGYQYFGNSPTLFDCFWRLPNGKILISSHVATPFLHYIHEPTQPGDACMFEQRAIQLPVDPLIDPYGTYIVALPNFPPFRMAALPEPCSTSTAEEELDTSIKLYSNPSYDQITLEHVKGLDVSILNIYGVEISKFTVPMEEDIFNLSLDNQVPGIYFFVFTDHDGKFFATKKFCKL